MASDFELEQSLESLEGPGPRLCRLPCGKALPFRAELFLLRLRCRRF